MPVRRLAGGPFRLNGDGVMADEKKSKGVRDRIKDLLGRDAPEPARQAPKASQPAPMPAPRRTKIEGRPTFESAHHPLMDGCPPDWASGWGDDRYGVFVEFTLGEVTQRLRWIGPGRFQMGSPEDEPGRWDREGPQHEVRISSGFWLFDTPVTQALWTAVMGDNPSRFKDPKRPVESLSWDDAMRFLEKINAAIPGLDLVLPTEAQWEYACRAGTNTATYVGPIEILGARNAPILDEIAWYGGNSGVDFELENGVDSSSWSEKQYQHNRAGTRPVGLKLRNPWGLYDMLGNVWEWCADYRRKYEDGAVTDPVGPLDGARRALRGGSWNDDARYVRAAGRLANDRGYRDNGAGFRCARVRP